MPYTHGWSVTTPLDASLADLLGQDIRDLRLDIQERMNSTFATDWTADPVVAKDGLIGKVTGAQRVIPACSFLSDLNMKENDLLDGKIVGFCGSPNLYAPIFIPGGCGITKVEWQIDRHDATSLDLALFKKDFNTSGGLTVVNTSNYASATGMVIVTQNFSHTIANDGQYQFRVIGNGGAGSSYFIYAIRITFDRDLTSHAS